MSSKLTQIINAKRSEIEQQKESTKLTDFEASTYFSRIGKSLKDRLSKHPGIITEFKRSSPSEGSINQNVRIQSVVRGYDKAGAAGISVLTDEKFFGGSIEDLVSARQITDLPILRKDFIIDEFQVYEAKAHGADVILLIAESLDKKQLKILAELAQSIQLEVLMEIHSADQLEKVNEFVDIVGVNNRDLSTLEVDLETSKQLADQIPSQYIKISESGFQDPKDVLSMKQIGYQGFLIGSHFMRQEDPAKAASEFISGLS